MQKPANDFAHDCRVPAGHFAHVMQLALLFWSWYWPVGQSVHDASVDAVEYLPTAHAVHVVAPAFLPVLVTEPAAQILHAPTFDAVE